MKNRNISSVSSPVVPVKAYINVDTQRREILAENKGKSGIYKWTNKINGKTYIGSAINIPERLCHYYSKKHMETQLKMGRSAIFSGILKHGIAKFKLEILVYCSQKKCIKLEQKYFNLLKPEYNLLKTAGSCLGCKRSEETRAKMSAIFKGIPKSVETKAKISASLKGIPKP
jgi:group I intron endonuclease